MTSRLLSSQLCKTLHLEASTLIAGMLGLVRNKLGDRCHYREGIATVPSEAVYLLFANAVVAACVHLAAVFRTQLAPESREHRPIVELGWLMTQVSRATTWECAYLLLMKSMRS